MRSSWERRAWLNAARPRSQPKTNRCLNSIKQRKMSLIKMNTMNFLQHWRKVNKNSQTRKTEQNQGGGPSGAEWQRFPAESLNGPKGSIPESHSGRRNPLGLNPNGH